MHSAVAAPVATTTRLESLDVFRGLTMAAMVIVNNPGDWDHVYRPLLHAEWHGWTPTDLIFPFFLFIVGITLTLSRSHTSWARLLRRTVLLVGLGLVLGAVPFFQIERMRIPGVLQRIGICYFVAAIILRRTSSVAALLAIASALTLGYWALLMWVPPGAGDLSPAGNLGARVDRALLGGHLWKSDFDPEGLLSTIPAVATTLLGAVTGILMRSASSPRRTVVRLLAGGACAIVIGLLWNMAFPINKSLWTSSYVFFTAGMAAMILAVCYAAVDAWPSTLSRVVGRPLIVLGTNAILLYVLSSLTARLLDAVRIGGVTAKVRLYDGWFAPIASPINASLLFAITNLAVLFIVLLPLYRRRVFLKL
jgi:predicted acyltransferase